MRKFLVALVILLMMGTAALIMASTPLGEAVWPREQARPAFAEILNTESERIETITLEYAGLLTVNNQLGRIVIEGDDVSDISLRTVKRAKTSLGSGAELLDQIKVETAVTGGRTQIAARVPRIQDGDQVSVDLYLTVPREIVANIKVNLGEVEIKDVSGSLRIDNDLGSVSIRNFVGNAFIQADLGSVEIYQANFEDNLQISSSMGDVVVAGSLARSSIIESRLGAVQIFMHPDTAYEIEANIDLGNFEIAVPFSGERSQSSAVGTIGTGETEGSVELSISLGSLKIDYL